MNVAEVYDAELMARRASSLKATFGPRRTRRGRRRQNVFGEKAMNEEISG
jgi:hypothetical protein